jgi:Carboxypeptidase regulatory-like domain/TonB dependent receptor-like, beta-barrel/TonB-dependent Receptor Plug Domain
MKSAFRWQLLLCALLCWGMLQAQDITKGSIAGVVRDPSGAVIPGARVTLSSPNGNRITTTDAVGGYTFMNLTAGPGYNLTVDMKGFVSAQAHNVSVGINHQTTQDFTMQVGQATQQVEVVATGTSAIDLSSTATGGVLNQTLYTNVPIGRNVSSVINMAPGVTDSAGAGAANPAINGASGLENEYFVDGANITDPGFGGFGTFSRNFGSKGTGVNFDFIQEVQVITGGFEAQYGAALGGIINVITKSGSNNFHGSVYGYFAPTGLSVNNKDLNDVLTNKLTYVQNQSTFDFGGDFGGYIIKDKLFFYGGFNPVFNNSYQEAAQGFGNYSLGLVNVSSKTLDYTGKINWNIGSKHQLEGSVFGDPSNTPMTYNRGLNSSDDLRESKFDYGSRTWTGRYTGAFTSSLVVTANYSEYFNHFTETPKFNGYEVTDNTPEQENTGSPFTYNGLGYVENTQSHTHQFNTSASWVKSWFGQHTLELGYQFEDDPYGDVEQYSGPDFVLPNDPVLGPAAGQTMHGAAFIRTHLDPNDPSTPIVLEIIRGNYSSPDISTDTRYHAAYLEDTWSLGRRITLKPGLRFEQQELNGNDARYVFAHNWAPRIGVIFDPTGNRHSKFFANWGRFYEKVPLDIAVRSLSQETGFSGYVYYADPGPNQAPNLDPSQFLSQYSSTDGLTGATPTIIYGGTAAQYQDEAVGGYDHEFSDRFTISTRFTYRHLRRIIEDEQGVNATQGYDVYSYPAALDAGAGVPYVIGNPSASQDIFTNQTPCSGAPPACIDGWTPPNGTPGPDGIPDGFPNPSRIYKALEVVVSRRFSTNFQFYGSYVLSKLYGNYEGNYRADNGQIDPNISSMFDFTNTDGIMTAQFAPGVLPTDRRHQIKLFGNYELGKLNLGLGWNIQSGTPITGYLDHPVYLNAGEIPDGPRGAYGRTDWSFPLNLHADYTVKLTEAKLLKFGIDMFNVGNRIVPYRVDQNKEVDGSPGEANPDFLLPSVYTQPFYARLMVRFEF